MSSIENIRTINSGTFIFSGDRKEIVVKLVTELQNTHEIKLYDKKLLDIESVREIIQEHTNKANKQRCFILSFYSISIPAQNALLKLLEEPAVGTIICIVTYDIHKLLDTVRSRSQHIHYGVSSVEFTKKVQDFLEIPQYQRLESAFFKKNVSLKDTDEKVDKELISLFVESLISCAQTLEATKPLEEQKLHAKTFERILSLYSYADFGGSSIKNIAEFTALTLPNYKK